MALNVLVFWQNFGYGRMRTSKIFKMLSQTNGMTSTSDNQNQTSHIAVEKASSSSGKGE